MNKTTMEINFWNEGTKLLHVTRDDVGNLIGVARVEVVALRELDPVYHKDLVDGKVVMELVEFKAKYYVKSLGIKKPKERDEDLKDLPINHPRRRRARREEEGTTVCVGEDTLFTLEQFIYKFKGDLFEIEHEPTTVNLLIEAIPEEAVQHKQLKKIEEMVPEDFREKEADVKFKSIHIDDGGVEAQKRKEESE